MAKKDQELVQAALQEHKWINTPVLYTHLGNTFTQVQQDILLQVAGTFQSYVKDFYGSNRHKLEESPKSLFSEDVLRDLPPVRIELSNTNIGNNHYNYMAEAIKPLQELWIKAPVFDPDTQQKMGENWFPVFSKIYIPEAAYNVAGEEFKYHGDGPKSRRRGYIELTINKEVAPYVFNMESGYINHLERIALFSSSAYTSRLYLLLMQYFSRHQTAPLIDYRELKDFLGMYIRPIKSDEITAEKYTKFSQFRKQVLDYVKRDMERMSADNKIDITFDYEVVYPRGVTRGNPTAIRFFIQRTPLGLAHDLSTHRPSAEQRLADSLIKLYPTLDRASLLSAFSAVPDAVWPDYSAFAYKELPRAVERPHQWSGTPESYIGWLLKRKAEDLAAGTPAIQHPLSQPQQPDLFSSLPSEADIQQGAAQWQSIVSSYTGPLKAILMQTVFRGYENNKPLIEFPSFALRDEFNSSPATPLFLQHVAQVYGSTGSVITRIIAGQL